jgi:hypothetical protein
MKRNRMTSAVFAKDPCTMGGVIKRRAFSGSVILLLISVVFLFSGCDGLFSSNKPKEMTEHAAYKLDGGTATESYLAISSTAANEPAVNVLNGGSLTISDSAITKSGDSGEQAGGGQTPGRASGVPGGGAPGQTAGGPPQGDNPAEQAGAPEGAAPGGMPGQPPGGGTETANSGIYAAADGDVMLYNSKIETAAGQGKGLYATGYGSSITMSNGSISTTGDTSHGVFATYGGSISLNNVSISTKGAHCSVLATDTGGGAVTALGGVYVTSGSMSAGIYSTGNITVSNAFVQSLNDHGAVIDCDGQIALNNVKLDGGQNGLMIWNTVGSPMASYVNIRGGSINAKKGDVFLIKGKGQVANISVKGGAVFEASTNKLINVVESGTLNFIADGFSSDKGQELKGNIACDNTGSVTVRLSNGSSLTGHINQANTGKTVNLIIDAASKWNVTGQSVLTTLSDPNGISGDTIKNIYGNGFNVYYSQSRCPELGGKSYSLNGGGYLKAIK